MTDLTSFQKASIKFCKDCLGWKKAFHNQMQNSDQMFIDRGEHNTEMPIFMYTDLNIVLNVVRKWCYEHSFGWCLCSADETERCTAILYYEDWAEIYATNTYYNDKEVQEGDDENSCFALMSACINGKAFLDKERKKEEKRKAKK